ncbi:MAG: metallophosphoesterase [Burkholderiales bacterium]|uniref:Metallophosphoesterase n=1 Tax=Ottowia pentelensis TaxID=511108 RepID=A0ABV6PU31_9BURK|nr:metallophosphoesterase [Ottowia sp.]MBN9407057.1 metallophosphoesterase [Burkholderiales bacterium]MBS0402410.1 metallophosphoesterase [Pseudomonadota bacterium]MBS0415935.1 metallophosphoesterase [Pseudomonadota bacterium]
MKIQLLSDLHLEQNPDFQPQPAPDADLLVLAGDIGSYQRGSRLAARGDGDFGLARFSPLPRGAGWPVPVLYVPGNHEYDGLDVDATHARLRASCERLGIHWLEREQWLWQGVRLLGTTLWSDFEALVPQGPAVRPEQQTLARDKAFRAANHYLRHAGALRHGRVWLAEAIREQALACQAWLRAALAQPFDGPTVVITHFAPSLRSKDPRYGLTPGTAGFCNALDALFEQADLWLHGHLHCAHDYQAGRCRVVANPLGYADKGEQVGFRPTLSIPVPGTGP